MSEEKNHFRLTAQKIWNTAVKNKNKYAKEIDGELETHKRLLNLHQIGKFYYFVFDIFQGGFDYVSESVKDVLGYDSDEMNTTMFLDNVHPDDKSYLLNFEFMSIQFFKELPFDKIAKYKAQYDFRVKGKNNTYIRVLQQVIQIDYDQNNFYRSLGIHTDISHIKTEGIPCLSIIGLDGEPSYYNIPDANTFTKKYGLFTNREKEVLRCIMEGKSSKCIASELNLSLHTVHTHRKNILQKANVQTPAELISRSVTEGWV